MLFLINKGIFLVFDQLKLNFFKFHGLIKVPSTKGFLHITRLLVIFFYFFSHVRHLQVSYFVYLLQTNNHFYIETLIELKN